MNRAQDAGLENMCELSRAPSRVANRTGSELESLVLSLKARYPEWAGRKLSPILMSEHGVYVPPRTVARILKRNAMSAPGAARIAEPISFERETCGALLQMDFKGLPKSAPYALLTVIDDHSRFCLSFGPVPDKTGQSVQTALWELFGAYGMPYSMLMDNGDCWGSVLSKCPTRFEAWLMRLGVKPIHGRPMHPQTQGKVERFHLTAKTEMGERLIQSSALLLKPYCKSFVDRYNWLRPHESLGDKPPGSVFKAFELSRPESAPTHEIPSGTQSRWVDPKGFFSFRGTLYKIGRGLARERVVIQEAELGLRAFYAGFPLPYLYEL